MASVAALQFALEASVPAWWTALQSPSTLQLDLPKPWPPAKDSKATPSHKDTVSFKLRSDRLWIQNYFSTFYNCIVPMWFLLWEIRVAFPGESQLRQSRATQPTSLAGCFSVSIIHRTLTWTTGSFMYAQIFNISDCTHGCADTVRESALKVDCGRKIPCRTGESNLRQRHDGPMLYQWATSPPLWAQLPCSLKRLSPLPPPHPLFLRISLFLCLYLSVCLSFCFFFPFSLCLFLSLCRTLNFWDWWLQ